MNRLRPRPRLDLTALPLALAILCVGVLLPTLGTGCSTASTDANASGPDTGATNAGDRRFNALPVRTEAVTRGTLVRSLELGGVAEAWRSARLSPTAQGVVSKLPVQLGQQVKKGELLAELDTSTLRLQLRQAEKGAELGRLQMADAQANVDRAVALDKEGAISVQMMQQARLGLDLARAQVEQAEASLAVLRDQIDNARLKAPFDGTVTAVMLEQGEFYSAMASMTGPPALIGLDAVDAIRMDVRIPDVDLRRVNKGMKVLATTDALPGEEFEGEVQLVNAAADRGARTFLVRIRIENPDDRLKPGLFLTARLVLETREDALIAPQRAVEVTGDTGTTMVVVDGKAARRSLKLGLRGDTDWEVLEGLEEGTQVVVEGSLGLPDGAPVRTIE